MAHPNLLFIGWAALLLEDDGNNMSFLSRLTADSIQLLSNMTNMTLRFGETYPVYTHVSNMCVYSVYIYIYYIYIIFIYVYIYICICNISYSTYNRAIYCACVYVYSHCIQGDIIDIMIPFGQYNFKST